MVFNLSLCSVFPTVFYVDCGVSGGEGSGMKLLLFFLKSFQNIFLPKSFTNFFNDFFFTKLVVIFS